MINTGWISVKNEMPSEHESVFAKLKGTLRWNTNMFEKISNEVLVTLQYLSSQKTVTTCRTIDGKWKLSSICSAEVTHWMSLPDAPENNNKNEIDNAETADAVLIVRCKDCKHLIHNLDGTIECGEFEKARPTDYAYYPNILTDYCSHGEKRVVENNDL